MDIAQRIARLVVAGCLALGCGVAPVGWGGVPQGDRYEALYATGLARKQAGDFRAALRSLEDALALTAGPKDLGRRLDCLLILGVLHWNVGEMEESAACTSQALAVARELRVAAQVSACSKILRIHDLYSRGKELSAAHRYQESSRQFEAAISLAREQGLPEFELKCLRQLSLNHFDRDELAVFLEHNERALAIARELTHRPEEARCLNNIGLYYFRANRYSRALMLYENALQILRETDQYLKDKADCLNNIALIYLSLGNYDKALRYLKEAMNFDLQLGDQGSLALDLKNIGTVLRNKGVAHKSNAYIAESLSYYERCLAVSRDRHGELAQADLLNSIGLSFFSNADYGTALSYFRSALDKAIVNGRGGDIGAIACNIGQAYLMMGDFKQAKISFSSSIDSSVNSNRDEVMWEAYLGLGHCFEEEGERAYALSCYRKAADIIDTIRQQLLWDDQKTGFARDKWEVYEVWADLLLRMKQSERDAKLDSEIWMVVERAKARALSEGLSQGNDTGQNLQDPASADARKRLTRNISLTISRLARPGVSRIDRESLLESLERDEDEYAALSDRFRTAGADLPSPSLALFSLEDVQRRLLDAETAIVEFFLGEERSLVILVTPGEVVVEPLPRRLAIEESLKAYLKVLSTPPNTMFRGIKAGRRIYQELFSALEMRLAPSIKNLIIVPDGVLCYLPFETLVLGESEKGKAKFLIENFQVSYAPSVSSLALLAGRRPATGELGRILAMGDPVYASSRPRKNSGQKTEGDVLREIYQDNGFEFSRLPYSRREVLGIASAFRDKNVDLLTGWQAREDFVKTHPLENYRIIHFACHGFLDESAPHRSALVLSLDSDPEEDGFLQAREVYELRLKADLVVLSACQTGRGRLESGEGLLGLPRMFFYAGARATISSLWKITDRSTASLMRALYEQLAAGADAGRALRKAKLEMLRSKFAHPFYWGGFVLHGEYRPLK